MPHDPLDTLITASLNAGEPPHVLLDRVDDYVNRTFPKETP